VGKLETFIKKHKLVVAWQCYLKYVFCVLHPFVAPVGVS
jgi:hypothetical protein